MKKLTISLICLTAGAVIYVTHGVSAREHHLTSISHENHQVSLDYLNWLGPQSNMKPLKISRDIHSVGEAVSINRYDEERRKLFNFSGAWLQQQWIEGGLAIYNGLPGIPSEWRDAFLKAEKKAQRDHVGYWASTGILSAKQPHDISTSGSFEIVEGTVKSVGKSRGWIYLNFGSSWKTDFTAAIPPQSKAIFKSKGWKFDKLENISVRVRGYVRKYNGPFMELYFPEQIELSNEK